MCQPTRRIPFGFRGDWGLLYKIYTDGCSLNLKNETVNYEDNKYVEIGMSIQFKPVGEITITREQTLKGLKTPTCFITVETTDSYFDDNIKDYVCCIDVGDIVKVFDKVWIVTSIKENVKYTPKKLSFYYLDLTSLS